MSRSPTRPTSQKRQTTRRARQHLYILLAYDGQVQSLRLVWTGFRSHSPQGQAHSALAGLVQELLGDSAEVQQPTHTVVVPTPREPPAGDLTAREVEILQLIAQDKTSEEIAEALSVSRQTVQTHLRQILRTLKSRNRAEALLKAVQWGLIGFRPTPPTSARKQKRGRTGRPSARRH